MNAISLFSGIGGIDLALEPYCTTRLYCEIDPSCRKVLLARMANGQLPKAPIHPDVSTLTKETLQELLGDTQIDIITGGFPFMFSPPLSLHCRPPPNLLVIVE